MRILYYTLVLLLNAVTVFAQPAITSFSPLSGAVGSTVEINGSGFDATPANNVVHFGAVKATITAATITKLTVTVPTGGGSGPIEVVNLTTKTMDKTDMPFSITFTETSTPVSNSFYFDSGTHEFSISNSSLTTGYSAEYDRMASHDFDGDGKVDFVKVNGSVSSGKGADIYLNQSSGAGNFAFASAYNLPSTMNIGSVAVGDFNMDGKADIVLGSGNSSNSALVFKNSSTSGTLDFNTGSPVTIGSSAISRMKVADINVDGKPDIIYAYFYASTIYYVLNTSPGDGSISFGSQQSLMTGLSGCRGFAIGDLDGDGATDLAAFNGGSGTKIAVNDNAGSSPPLLTPFDHSASAYYGFNAIIKDLNQDGKNDIIRSDLNGGGPFVLQNNYTSGTMAASDFATNWTGGIGSFGVDGIFAVDMNGDGKLDLSKVQNSGVQLSTNLMSPSATISNTASEFSNLSVMSVSSTAPSIVVDDFDGDGKNDILWNKGLSSSNVIQIYENQVGEIKYYSKSSGNLSSLSTWGVATDGTGTNPSSFSGSEEFILANRSTYSLDADMTIGKLTLDTDDPFDIGAYTLTVSEITNADADSYIKTSSTGRLEANLDNGESMTFPIGNSAYNPITIENNTGAADDFAVKVIDEVYKDGSDSGTTVTGPRVKRTWDIDKTNANGGSGVDFVFNWNNGETSNLTTPALYHYGSTWTKVTGSPSSTSNSMTFTGYTGTFSPFAVGDAAAPLPVELASFKALLTEDLSVLLNWETVSELYNSHFEVERSVDGAHWEMINSVLGAGNSTESQFYQSIDGKPYIGTSYYRIKQVDLDGAFAYSPIESITIGRPVVELELYPNPATTIVNIISDEIEPDQLLLINAQGQVVSTDIAIEKVGDNQVQIHLTHLSKGVYFVKYKDHTKSFVIR